MTVPKPLTVSELTDRIKETLEEEFSGIKVEGEISRLIVAGSGHMYFTLKDEKAVIKGVMWKGKRKLVKFTPKDGDQVVCRGRLSLYAPKGEYQIVVDSMEPQGLGALQLAYEELKAKLEKEGLFDEARKRELPFIPWNVGIVTSPTGAVLRDIVRTIKRRFPGIGMTLAPVRVQGKGAEIEIAQAIADMNEHGKMDVIIVGRGGGSLEDLWAFNEEVVARAIYASKIPVVSAVGHETDFTIADFVADRRASTPTAAAEIVTVERDALEYTITDHLRSMSVALRNSMESRAMRADDVAGRLDRQIGIYFNSMSERIASATRHLNALSPSVRLKNDKAQLEKETARLVKALSAMGEKRSIELKTAIARLSAIRLGQMVRNEKVRFKKEISRLFLVVSNLRDRRRVAFRTSIARLSAVKLGVVGKEKIKGESDRLFHAVENLRNSRRKRFEIAVGKLESVNPLAVLNRGYSVVTTEDGKKVYRSASELSAGERVNIRFAKDNVKAIINKGSTWKQEKLF